MTYKFDFVSVEGEVIGSQGLTVTNRRLKLSSCKDLHERMTPTFIWLFLKKNQLIIIILSTIKRLLPLLGSVCDEAEPLESLCTSQGKELSHWSQCSPALDSGVPGWR